MTAREWKRTWGRRLGPDRLQDLTTFLSKVLALKKEELLLKEGDLRLTVWQLLRLNSMAKKRAKGLLPPYITGEGWFWGEKFLITRDTLAPRADTEVLLERAIDWAKKKERAKVLDLCTGCGCIGISIARAAGLNEITLTDIKKGALKIAKKNAKRLTPLTKVWLLKGDLFHALKKESRGNKSDIFDIITSNPPYIKKIDAINLLKDGRGDPLCALNGDGKNTYDGLYFVKRVLEGGLKHLTNGGVILVECGDDNILDAFNFGKSLGYKSLSIIKDLSGHDRVIEGVRG